MLEKEKRPIEQWIEKYGNFLFDLFKSVLGSHVEATLLFQKTLKQALKQYQPKNFYEKYERAWLIKIVLQILKEADTKHSKRLSPPEQLMLDATLKPEERFRFFESYLHRLSVQDQLLLILHDKHQIPLNEIALAFSKPEESIKFNRLQLLKLLREWIWKN